MARNKSILDIGSLPGLALLIGAGAAAYYFIKGRQDAGPDLTDEERMCLSLNSRDPEKLYPAVGSDVPTKAMGPLSADEMIRLVACHTNGTLKSAQEKVAKYEQAKGR
ncbi:MAG: hypothetical protein M0T85_01835 [Dehalococcoidales bacterium]|nr:hypothetical protein [Dehalococcoidales bacterium]